MRFEVLEVFFFFSSKIWCESLACAGKMYIAWASIEKVRTNTIYTMFMLCLSDMIL